jgi:hypothetical protein
MKFILEIQLGNERMSEFEHIADALQTAAARILVEDAGTDLYPQKGFTVRDGNGNTVGFWDIKE